VQAVSGTEAADSGPEVASTAALFNLDETVALMCTQEQPFIDAVKSTFSPQDMHWDETLAVWRVNPSVRDRLRGLVGTHFEQTLDLTPIQSWTDTRRPLFEHRAKLTSSALINLPRGTTFHVEYIAEDILYLSSDCIPDQLRDLLTHSSLRTDTYSYKRGRRMMTRYYFMLANSPEAMRVLVDHLDTPVHEYQGVLVREGKDILYFESDTEEAIGLPLSRINLYQYGIRNPEMTTHHIVFHKGSVYLIIPLKSRMMSFEDPVTNAIPKKFPGDDFYYVLISPMRVCEGAQEPLVSSLTGVLEVSQAQSGGPHKWPRWYDDLNVLVSDLGLESFMKRYISKAMSFPPKIGLVYSGLHTDPEMPVMEVTGVEVRDPIIYLTPHYGQLLQDVMCWDRPAQIREYVARLKMLYDLQKKMLSDEHKIDRLVDAVLNDRRFGKSAATFRRQLERNREKASTKWDLEHLARWAFETDSISTGRWDAIYTLTRTFAEFWSNKTDIAIRKGLIDHEGKKPGSPEELIAAIERHHGLSRGQQSA